MATKYEMSKTYQYRKVMKPLLERKRRARINKCLDDLKDLMAKCLHENDPYAKLEKADILELTVQHLRKIKSQKQSANAAAYFNDGRSFRSGYIEAANEVSHCLGTMPNINVEFGKRLMTQLGLRLRQLESSMQSENAQPTTVNAQIPNDCSNYNNNDNNNSYSLSVQTCSSPVPSMTSSGYASDYSDQRWSPVPLTKQTAHSYRQNLLQIAKIEKSIWRPW